MITNLTGAAVDEQEAVNAITDVGLAMMVDASAVRPSWGRVTCTVGSINPVSQSLSSWTIRQKAAIRDKSGQLYQLHVQCTLSAVRQILFR